MNAPHILLPSELHGSSTAQLDSDASTVADTDPDTAARGWWRANKERTKAVGIEESILTIRDILRGQRFDVRFILSESDVRF